MIALAHGKTRDVLWCARHARGLNCASWSKYGALHRVRLPPERVRSLPKRERSIFSFQTIVDFVLSLLGHALGLDHHDALLNFRANALKHAKTEGFFQQRELRKADTAREVCVGMAAQIAVVQPMSAGVAIRNHKIFRFSSTS